MFERKGSNWHLSTATTPSPRPCALLRISRRSRRPIRFLRSTAVVPMHGWRNENAEGRDCVPRSRCEFSGYLGKREKHTKVLFVDSIGVPLGVWRDWQCRCWTISCGYGFTESKPQNFNGWLTTRPLLVCSVVIALLHATTANWQIGNSGPIKPEWPNVSGS